MLKKMKEKKGFTLAELLVVVAIIAVLVAISIPVFSVQLEKAREATDAANIRAAYAEVLTAALTEDQSTNNVEYDRSTETYSKSFYIKQRGPEWITEVEWPDDIYFESDEVSVGGSCTVSYTLPLDNSDAFVEVYYTEGRISSGAAYNLDIEVEEVDEADEEE